MPRKSRRVSRAAAVVRTRQGAERAVLAYAGTCSPAGAEGRPGQRHLPADESDSGAGGARMFETEQPSCLALNLPGRALFGK